MILPVNQRKISVFISMISAVVVAAFLFIVSPNSAAAALLINRPLYIGLNSGLVGYWSFDGPDMANVTAYDRSGNANNGTLTNGPTRAVGRIGQALEFDGADDRVDISSPSFNGAEPFTISVWIKPASLGEGSLGRIMSFNNATTDDLRMGVGPLVNFSPNGGAGGDCDSNNITLNVWVHVVFTLSSTGVCTFYIDGVNQTFDSSGQTIGASTSFSIGNLVGGVTRTFDGPIDEFRFYNRILSPDEIKRLYKIGATLKVNKPNYVGLDNGLVGYWSFDGPDMAGNTAYDRSGQNNHVSSTGSNMPTRSAGKIGQGLKFDNANDYIEITSFARGGNFTWAGWIFPITTGGGDKGRLFNNGITGAIQVGLYVSGSPTPYIELTTNTGVWRSPSGSIELNKWQHVAVVFDSTSTNNDPVFYINGSLVSTSEFTTPTNTPSDNVLLTIGNNPNTELTRTFDGTLDEMRAYNRALSADEIKRLYKIGATLKVNKPNYVGLNSGLVGYWSFDGPDMYNNTALDRSGQGNNGTLTNGPTRKVGRIGQGLEFDGSNDYVDIANESNFDFERTQPFSYSLWTKPKAGDTSISLAFGKILNSGNFTGWALLTNYDYSSNTEVAGRLAVALINISGTTNAIGIEADSKINDGGWHHYTVTYDGSSFASGIKIYEDGISLALNVASDSLTGSILNNVNVEIGDRDSGASSLNYPGLIDEVRIYNRALSGDEIKRLYNLGR